MTHFTDAELLRWRETDAGPETERLIAHLSECGPCARRFAAAIRTRPPDASSNEHADVFARVGVAIPERPRQVLTFPARRWRRIALPAAAAALVAAIVVPRLLYRNTADAGPGVGFRSSGIHTLTPAGAVGREARFTWSSGLAAARFRIDLGGASGLVYHAEVAASPAPLPGPLLDTLTPGAEYWWTVTALDANGHALGVSDRRTFTLRAR